MATKQEKNLIGLPDDATQEQFEATLRDLVAARQLLEERPAADSGKIALISLTGKPRNRGTYVIPCITPGEEPKPLVLDLATLLAEPSGKQNLADIDSDPRVMALRNDTPLTPKSNVQRYKRS